MHLCPSFLASWRLYMLPGVYRTLGKKSRTTSLRPSLELTSRVPFVFMQTIAPLSVSGRNTPTPEKCFPHCPRILTCRIYVSSDKDSWSVFTVSCSGTHINSVKQNSRDYTGKNSLNRGFAGKGENKICWVYKEKIKTIFSFHLPSFLIDICWPTTLVSGI